jgi:hypothetical protein
MTTPRPAETADTSLTRDLLYATRYYLGGRRGLLIAAALALVGGIALNWSWLVAAGLAPILLAALPCVAMCALGLCANKLMGRSCSTETPAQKKPETPVEDATPIARAAIPEDASDRPTDGPLSDSAAAGGVTPQPQPVEEKRTTHA